MKVWNRINNSDRKKLNSIKARMVLSSFAYRLGYLKQPKGYSKKKRKYMTVVKL